MPPLARDAVARAQEAGFPYSCDLAVGRLLAALARSPAEVPALIRLGGCYRSARRALTAVAGSSVLAPAPAPAPVRAMPGTNP